MQETLRDAIHALRAAYLRGELVLVLGPRPGIAQGAPSEIALAHELLTDLDPDATLDRSPTWTDRPGISFSPYRALGMIADAWAWRHGSARLRERITARYAQSAAAPAAVHRMAASLSRGRLAALVDLAWDGLLARALADAGVTPALVSETVSQSGAGGPRLLEALGSVARPDTLALAASEMAARLRGARAEALYELFATRDVLVLGAEPDHPVLAAAAPIAVAAGKRPRAVVFQPESIAREAWAQAGWSHVEPASDTPSTADEFGVWLLTQVRGPLVPLGSGGVNTASPPREPNTARVATELRPEQLEEHLRTLEHIVRAAHVELARVIGRLGLKAEAWNGDLRALVTGLHAGRSGTHGSGRGAVCALVRALQEELPGSVLLQDLSCRLDDEG